MQERTRADVTGDVPPGEAGLVQTRRFNQLPEPVKAYFSVLYRLQNPRLNAAQRRVLKQAQLVLLEGITHDEEQRQALATFLEYLGAERKQQAAQKKKR